MDQNPYESPREPSEPVSSADGKLPYPLWATAIDVIVVLVILAVLAAMFLPAGFY